MTVAEAIDIRDVVAAIESVVGAAKRPVALHEPRFAGHEWDYVKDCLDTGWVSSAGKYVDRFESELAHVCGTKFAVAVVNGTAALQVALHLVGVCPGDEVIVPTLTFVATANAVAHCGAVPHFVDSEAKSFGIDASKLEDHLKSTTRQTSVGLINQHTGRTIRAVVPVHVFGHPADMDALNRVCEEFVLPVIEDATESVGSTYTGRPCGSMGLLGVLSFNGNKIVTTGGGGAIVTDNEKLAKHAKHVTTTAKVEHPWAFVHDEIGWNYRLPNLNAALGVAQLEQLDGFVAAKRALADRYFRAFAQVEGARIVREPPHARSNYWLNAMMLDDDTGRTREVVLRTTHQAGILTRPAWTPMHTLAPFRDCPRDDLSVAESIERRLVNLPSSAALGMDACG